jgi:hypothetical protein
VVGGTAVGSGGTLVVLQGGLDADPAAVINEAGIYRMYLPDPTTVSNGGEEIVLGSSIEVTATALLPCRAAARQSPPW